MTGRMSISSHKDLKAVHQTLLSHLFKNVQSLLVRQNYSRQKASYFWHLSAEGRDSTARMITGWDQQARKLFCHAKKQH